MMMNFYKYLPVSSEDKKWGLYVLNAGYNSIPANKAYPPKTHPSHHYFNWQKGRVFDEFQIIYITKGEGVFESKTSGQHQIKAGSIIYLFPGEWHRYKPSLDTGWDEQWVGFKGEIVTEVFKNNFLSPSQPVVPIGLDENVLHLFLQINENVKNEKPGYQPLISGMILHLLGLIHSLSKWNQLKRENISELMIKDARAMLRAGFDQQFSMEKLAKDLNVSYSWFRKAFKIYTGMAPNQYLLQLRTEKAKELLSDPSKSIKQIAFELGFESEYYFSRLFKEKIGCSPQEYKKELFRE